MSPIYPLIASVLQAASFTIDKIILTIKRVTHKTYVSISFPLIFIFTLIIFLIFKPALTIELFAGNLLWLILASITLTIAGNLIFYKALDYDCLNEIQIISLLSGIPLIISAAIFFPDERNSLITLMALAASASVAWAHWKGKSFHIAKRTLPYLLWTLLVSPLRGIISKILLESWNPISLQLIINGASAIFFIIIFSKNLKTAPMKALPFLIITNLLTTIAWILYYFSYQISGIIYTVLIFSLQPLLVYAASLIFLKEKFHWKKFAAFMITLAAIIISQINLA